MNVVVVFGAVSKLLYLERVALLIAELAVFMRADLGNYEVWVECLPLCIDDLAMYSLQCGILS